MKLTSKPFASGISMRSSNENSLESEKMSRAFQAVGLFLYEFSQLEFIIRALLAGYEDSSEKQPEISPENFLTVCTEAQKFFAQKVHDSEGKLKELFDKCRELNDDRMVVVQGFMADKDGAITPQFDVPNIQKAYRFFTNPEELISRANIAREMADEFVEGVFGWGSF